MFKIKKSIKDKLAKIAEKYDLDFIIGFGSWVKRPTPLSDIDIAVHVATDIEETKVLDLQLSILADIVQLFKRNDVDLIILNNAPLDLSYEAFRNGILLYCRDFEVYAKELRKTIGQYLDFLPALEKQYKIAKGYFLGSKPKLSLKPRIVRAREAFMRLERVLQVSIDEYINNPLLMDATERNLHIALQAMLDIGNYIIAEKGWEKPKTYADIVRILCRHNVLFKKWENDLIKMVSLRNLLIHGYALINHELLYNTLHEKLLWLKEVVKALIKLLKAK